MAKSYLDKDGLLYFWQKIKALFVSDITYNSTSKKIQKTKAGAASDVVTLATVATSGSYTDLSNTPTIPTGVEPSSTTPKMDGTATVGTETKFARGDHIHPTDTSRVPTSRKVNGKTLSADVTIDSDDIVYMGNSSWSVTQALDDLYTSSLMYTSFGSVKVGATLVAANSMNETLELTAGSNVTLTPDATNQKVTIAAQDTTYSDATTSTHGLMSTSDKTKLDKLVFNGSNKIDPSILPSYVDDVIEAYARSGQTALSSTWLAMGSASGTVITPEAGKIYVLMADSGDYAANTQFRWGGTAYVKLSDGGVSSITNAEIDTIVAS